MIPYVILFDDDVLASRYVGFARQQLDILRKQLSYRGLKSGYRTISPAPDTVVECQVNYKMSYAYIRYRPPEKEVEPPEEKKPEEEKKLCPCYKCFAFGVIQAIATTPSSAEYTEGMRYAYDILVCQSKKYILLENLEVKAIGWEEYYVGQHVMVGLDLTDEDDEVPGCCDSPGCFASSLLNTDKMIPDILSIYPVHSSGVMKEWFLR